MLQRLQQWLQGIGLTDWFARNLSTLLVQLVLILLVAWLSDIIVKRILHRIIRPIVKRTRTSWDDAIVQRGVLGKLAHLVPAWLIFTFLPPVLEPFPRLSALAANFVEAYMILVVTLALSALIAAGQDISRGLAIAKHAPTEIISQALRIAVWCIGFILILAALVDRSPLVFFSGLGAMTAVLMLIFKDSLLGLVAGLQIASNDLVREGDWIEIPKYGADGTVTEVGLMTVKVQNWDKTISSVPTYALVSDSFKNWRGMELSGGRRIKRAVSLDMTTVRFCDKEMLARFSKIQYLRDHIERKTKELAAWNKERAVDDDVLVNGRRLTNLGCFRAYLEAYLRNHPQVHPEGLTFLVRHLPPGPTGIPIEVYVFSKDQRWVQYEGIQADIFDHILAVIPQFDLRVFQEPTGSDFQRLISRT
jgi:miniconductance mechanosensitive channel